MFKASLPKLLLRLYPRSFRAQFADEWYEVAKWHERQRGNGTLSRVRGSVALVIDSARTLPRLWFSRRKQSGMRPHGRRGRLQSDLRHAMRGLTKNRAFAVAAILSVAVGIAANTATFSVANAVLFRPLPYQEPDRLTMIWNSFPGATLQRLPLSGPEIESLRQEERVFESVGGIWATTSAIQDIDGRSSQVSMGIITPNFFDVLGIAPTMGRSFVRDPREGADPQGVVLSHETWQDVFGAYPNILGSTISLGGDATVVIGVLPADFTLYVAEDGAIPPKLGVYVALPWDLTSLNPTQHFLRVVARLQQGIDQQEATAAAVAAAERARQVYPDLQATGDVFSAHPLQADAARTARPVLLALIVAVALFLLLACGNVASLILARSVTRSRELAIRTAVGASRNRLVQLLAIENLLITVTGASAGIALGRWGGQILWSLRPAGLARMSSLPFDSRVLWFGIASAIAVGLIFTFFSLISIRNVPLNAALRSGGRAMGGPSPRLREAIIACEVAIGLVLVVGSALMVQSVTRLGRESIGFDPSNALTFKLSVRGLNDAGRRNVASELERRLTGLPGVTQAGASSHLPFAEWANWADAAPPQGVPDEDQNKYFADLRSVSTSYLLAVGAELVEGRLFTSADNGDTEPVVVIDEAMAQRAFPGASAVGRLLVPPRYVSGGFMPTVAKVVGVIRNIRDRSPSTPSGGQVFWPFAQSPRWELTWFLRTAGDPEQIAEAVRSEVVAVNPDLALSDLRVMSEYVTTATALTRFMALVGSVFSIAALVVAAIGLYGVVTFVTVRRKQEFGMRMVLGAMPRDLVSGVLAHGFRIGAVGVAVGALLALGLSRFLNTMVYGVKPYDPLTLGLVALLLLAVAVGSSFAPAYRATQTDPLEAMREG